MKDGGNLDDVMPEPIHDTVVAVDDLADSFVAELRHDASRARVVLESLHSGDDAFDDEIGVVRRVTGHMRAYRLDVLDRLRRPDDLGHLRSRRFASAWAMPCPASSSANPRSVFAKSTRRSMASSSVASAGSFSITSRTFCLALPADIGASLAAPSSTVRITQSNDDRRGQTANAANGSALSGRRWRVRL